MIAEIERDMVALLAAALPDLRVESFPDKPDAYRLGNQVGAVLVGYAGSRLPDPFVLAGNIQKRRLEYQLVVKVRSLRDHSGAYAVLETIRAALAGQDLRGARFYPVREQFEDVSSGVWTYLAVYAADVPWVSQTVFPDDVAVALAAAQITLQGGLDGDAPITVGG
ncbi:hypothetical protein JCM15519_04350 [Fundidesulfovibrio butyratiphilus]